MKLEVRVAQTLDDKLAQQIEQAHSTLDKGVHSTYDHLRRNGVKVTYDQVYTYFKKNGLLKAYKKGGASELTEKEREEIKTLSKTHSVKEIVNKTKFAESTVEVIVGNYRDSLKGSAAKGKEDTKKDKDANLDAFKWAEWIRVTD